MTQTNRILDGIVVSNKAEKTIVVSVSSRSKTRYKGKTVKKSQRYIVHDPSNDAKEGDIVQITSSRPLSKLKRWRLFKILVNSDTIPVSLDKESNK
tara:strand:- start:291 stop:578 length:288 start_codon:yes stop_codon:yes gene_type:complete